jgi:peptide chain release factor 1
MIEKAKAAWERWNELGEQMSDPAFAADGVALARLGKERATLEPLAMHYAAMSRVIAELEDARASLNDPDLGELARDEIAELEPQLAQMSTRLEELLLPRDPDADRNVIMEIRQGSGGEEARLWAGDLYRMYNRFAESRGWKVEPISVSEAELGGLKEVVFGILGAGAWDCFAN